LELGPKTADPHTSAQPSKDSAPVPSHPAWFRWLMPSVTDLVFVLQLGVLVYAPLHSALLRDAGLGWHIRNGEYMVATRSVPRVDYFSYTKSGQPWYAWEWLYDVLIWLIDARLGLNGVVLFSALVIAVTFTLLFRLALARSGHLLIGAGLVLLAAAASTTHVLARPHVLTWLFTVIWWQILDRSQSAGEGFSPVAVRPREFHRSGLLWLPALMLLWVNIHGGFVLGLVLLGLYLTGHLWTWLTVSDGEQRQQAAKSAANLGIATALTTLATLANPYGYRLHLHVYGYLSNRFFMDHIQEFLSPNFHGQAEQRFEALLLLTIAALAIAPGRIRAGQLLVVLFAVHAALFAVRNVPISAILLTLVSAPLLGKTADWAGAHPELSPLFRGVLTRLHAFSARISNLEYRFRGHALPVVAVVLSLWISFHGGRLLSHQVLAARWDPNRFPVKATEFLAAQGIHDHVFTPDDWGGYLIYQLHPRLKVMVDDRHDFYGEPFLKDYLRVKSLDLGWKTVLEQQRVNWVLVPPRWPVASALKEMPEWKVLYDDKVAILFGRVTPVHP